MMYKSLLVTFCAQSTWNSYSSHADPQIKFMLYCYSTRVRLVNLLTVYDESTGHQKIAFQRKTRIACRFDRSFFSIDRYTTNYCYTKVQDN